jgi:phenylalanyl-tRNA synthetase beta subunit
LFESEFLAKNPATLDYHKKLKIQGLKNYGIRLVLGSFERTLTDSEVAGILDKIMLKLQGELKAEIR